jgi:hypothetical protein
MFIAGLLVVLSILVAVFGWPYLDALAIAPIAMAAAFAFVRFLQTRTSSDPSIHDGHAAHHR